MFAAGDDTCSNSLHLGSGECILECDHARDVSLNCTGPRSTDGGAWYAQSASLPCSWAGVQCSTAVESVFGPAAAHEREPGMHTRECSAALPPPAHCTPAAVAEPVPAAGVALSSTSRVTHLGLPRLGLRGGLSGLEGLRFLRVLDLSHNELQGNLSALAELHHLVDLRLQGNQFNGTVDHLG